MFFIKDKKKKIIFGSSERCIEKLFYLLNMESFSVPEIYENRKLTKFKNYKIFLFIRNPYERAVAEHLKGNQNIEPQLSAAWNSDIIRHDKLYIFDIVNNNLKFIENIYNKKINKPLVIPVDNYKDYLKDTKTIVNITLNYSDDIKFFKSRGFDYFS